VSTDFTTWLDTPFSFPAITGKRVLVLGLGGGCDILLAHAIAGLLPGGARSLVYANTKKHDDGSLEMLSPHIARLRAPSSSGKGRTHGTTRIDQSVPQGDEGCPWIFLLPEDDPEELTQELRTLAFDLLIGVDTGGDAIVDRAGSGDGGRDKRMFRVLQTVGNPLLVIAAPCSDGDATAEDVHRAFRRQADAGRYRGCFSLEPTFGSLRSLSQGLTPGRTPRIILSAADGLLQQTEDGRVVVPRGIRPAVPRIWLSHAFVFGQELT
jgi:hypothetical protein